MKLSRNNLLPMIGVLFLFYVMLLWNLAYPLFEENQNDGCFSAAIRHDGVTNDTLSMNDFMKYFTISGFSMNEIPCNREDNFLKRNTRNVRHIVFYAFNIAALYIGLWILLSSYNRNIIRKQSRPKSVMSVFKGGHAPPCTRAIRMFLGT